jgi:PEP-CTERM motif
MFEVIICKSLRAGCDTRLANRSESLRNHSPHAIRKTVAMLAVACGWLIADQSRPLSAAILATATITDQQIDANTYQYDITLNNTGNTNIGVFWYAWIPGDGFLHSQPTNIVGPAGWTDSVTQTYAIQWVNNGNAFTHGTSLSGFQFDSVDTPSQVFGLSQAFPTTPVGTSVVYIGSSPTGLNDEFVVQSTPEPSTWILCGAGMVGLLLVAWRRRRAARPAAILAA